jgi:PBP1b-binding outer membrane lipoprotein LpoB
MKKIIALTCLLALAACGGGGVNVVDTGDAVAVSEMENVMGLEYRDWEKTAARMTEGMLESSGFARAKDPVIVIGDIKNDTMQRIDSDILTKKIRATLVNSGRAKITTSFQNREVTDTKTVPVKAQLKAVHVGDKTDTVVDASIDDYVEQEYKKNVAEDETTHLVRKTRGNEEYAQGTIAKKGTLIAPNMSLSGKMIQRNLKMDSGMFSGKKTRVEYYLQLTLTDVETGLSIWEDEQPIIKEGRNAPTW